MWILTRLVTRHPNLRIRTDSLVGFSSELPAPGAATHVPQLRYTVTPSRSDNHKADATPRGLTPRQFTPVVTLPALSHRSRYARTASEPV